MLGCATAVPEGLSFPWGVLGENSVIGQSGAGVQFPPALPEPARCSLSHAGGPCTDTAWELRLICCFILVFVVTYRFILDGWKLFPHLVSHPTVWLYFEYHFHSETLPQHWSLAFWKNHFIPPLDKRGKKETKIGVPDKVVLNPTLSLSTTQLWDFN